ncbi:putative sister chromatid cohesion protein Dcc1 [Aspergillus clavatus NRRL 1]|uniref:Sister chromatid cohesion protein Dcc1 n=1 Tax=Aspergillus clavatus (strain ATCC 1007 / CBS 513.65 / DSM 816 / NCTC 3887 / NRRL 1 / QM 1276 / 107) TaxID=344612 RepID=A1C7S8_ASPCL|nr:uncharacterized protein ACLA_074870 [Aspergillus clavatus NRRL 1]EAW14449.1 hypothetical protein ACLA_074870 [Aspergillus clavatus NRRL 1]
MSTQAARSILFTHTSPQQGFRLLELPPELAELLTSKHAPTLELKSPAAQGGSATEARDYVNLCTPTRTYRLRQVQSSNPLHILRPSDGGVPRGDIAMVGGEEELEQGLIETVTSIAKCGSTLEVHTPPEGFSAIPVLERLLRVYEGSEDVDVNVDVEGGGGGREDAEAVMRRVFADVPVSRAQCERGWTELCAFVSGGERCWRPAAGAKLRVWKRVLEGAVLQGIRLEQQFLVSDLWRAVLEDGEDAPFPRPLFEAVVRRVCEAGEGEGEARGLASGNMKCEYLLSRVMVGACGSGFWADELFTGASIDKDTCTRWVGEMYLEAVAPTSQSAIGRSEFLNAWKDHLPENWRDEVVLSKLADGVYGLPDPTTICFVNSIDRQKVNKNVSAKASAATAAKKSRNWHEVFKNQKRQKN